ncbi:SAVED domain-containing protein [Actinomadura decatromicini]|uniref:SAVED domain-containing protein n=1 Tax=Actinomadura decatromicini TaxID=2604572 RepID=A0A5D3FWA8_9ACTN|nr:SAVED domain-containing protein [Actinomadura decatromicini]TYK52611.1 SAVED domain-containing protein [Actinomadura decatromicini]
MTETRNAPTMTVIGGPSATPSKARRVITDGAAWSGLGGVAAGGFGIEAVKSAMTHSPTGRWWLVFGCLAGLAGMAVGARLRVRASARTRIGLVVTASDTGRGAPRAELLESKAVEYSKNTCAVTVRTHLALPETHPWPKEGVDALADETIAAAGLAERLVSGAARINVIPTMPLPVGFRFGARIGHTHPREITVHAVRQRDGSPSHFPATSLRENPLTAELLTMEQVEVVDGGDPTRTALAIDLQNLRSDLAEPVRAACRAHRIGNLLIFSRMTSGPLDENAETYTAIVEQICRAWRDAPLPAAARTGRHAAFLTGPVAISIALGARLAHIQPDRWTAFTFDNASNAYEPFPAEIT